MRSVADILREIDAFEEQFRPTPVPPDTPGRKALFRASCDSAHRLACLPENVTQRLALRAELKRAQRSERAHASMAKRLADPVYRDRQWLLTWLRKLGYTRRFTSGQSAYYTSIKSSIEVRVSDHEVPETPERDWNVQNGGRSWAGGRGWQFFPGRETRYQMARQLVELREATGYYSR